METNSTINTTTSLDHRLTPSPSETLTEDEASLIREAFHRQALVSDLDRLIVADVRRRARHAWLRRWARIVIFSFGLPLVVVLCFACAYIYIKEHGVTTLTLALMVWPTLAMLYTTHHAISNFSPEEV